MEAVAHAAAVQPLIGKQAAQVMQDLVMLLVVQVLRRGLGIVIPELDRDAVGQEPLHIGGQLVRRIALVQYAVDPGGTGNAAQYLVRALLHILLQMAGDIHAGDLILVAPGKVQHFLQRGMLLYREGGVDIHLMGSGNGIQHLLQGLQIRQRLSAGKHKIAPGRDGIQRVDRLKDLLQ